ncbi:ABC transporter substrate-binding protein [Tepidicaulis sp.]|uniref:ABC transporter substrate-binding protein n=1 Tax=Tepidicaulis sp. TaxID=1920809 RepID=UPI003B59A7DA
MARIFTSGLIAAALLLVFASLGARAGQPPAPQKIVSLNLCSDIYLLMLAAPGTVRSVSFLAQDPSLSPVADKAKTLHANAGEVEELIAMHPDLVLAHEFTSPLKLGLFDKLGIETVKVSDPQSFADIRANLRRIAKALGRVDEGEEAVRRFDAVLAGTHWRESTPRARVIVYRPRGFAAGDGGLTKELLEHVGLANLSGAKDDLGAYMPLEEVLLADPDYIIVSADALQQRSLVRALLDHAAMRHFDKTHEGARIAIPSDMWSCGTPFIAGVVERLAALPRAPLEREARQ